MPRKRKKFIDKKNAVTFHLVHRSQQDPLVTDETAPQRVLIPVEAKKKNNGVDDTRIEEQRKFGVYFDDEYNYLQHLRDLSTVEVDWEPVESFRINRDPSDAKVQLPSSVFASEVEEDVGLLNKAAPHSGPRLDLDPDVVAAMDDDFDFDDPENELEDNFIELANEGSNADDEIEEDDVSLGADEDDDDVWSLTGPQQSFTEEETKSHFTNYSLTSSVIRRTEQLTLLDNRFHQMFEGYEDADIGALDCEDIEGHVAPNSELVLQYAEEFEKQQQHSNMAASENIAYEDDSEDGSDLIEIEVHNNEEKWDCESILSTYSNLYNHPKLITAPPARIQVSQKTGIPLNVLHGRGLTAHDLKQLDGTTQSWDGEEAVSVVSALSLRPKNETAEERRSRKRALKEYRKERRLERKANTVAFKEEKKRQEKVILNNTKNMQGIKIL